MIKECLKQRFAIAVLVLLVLTGLSYYELTVHDELSSGLKRLRTVVTLRANDSKLYEAILRKELLNLGDKIAWSTSPGSRTIKDSDVRSWYRMRAELKNAEDKLELGKIVQDHADTSLGKTKILYAYHRYKLIALSVLLGIGVIAFFIVNIERRFKWLLLKNIAFSALMLGFCIALIYILDVITLLHGRGKPGAFVAISTLLLVGVVFEGKRIIRSGTAGVFSRHITPDFMRMLWISTPILFLPHFILLGFGVAATLGLNEIPDCLGRISSALGIYVLLSYLVLPLRITRARDKFNS